MIHAISQLVQETTTNSGASVGGVIGGLIGYLISALALFGMFKKAGEPGWAAFVPFYSSYVLVKISGYNGWLFLLFFIPIVGFVWAIVVAIALGKSFDKGAAFSVILLWLLSVIGFFIVSYGGSRYVGPGGRAIASA
ncbi:DUF5684 domain-containing protein [Lapillicoccus sp.]|uniref:DUF5684 domain-containing protein n=1 Tax=Lapillicoccus sp. TaxID=1909287 RepID=UPI0027C2626C|nr:DUF5684 domain-containing protein [Actinomycetota bacterium]